MDQDHQIDVDEQPASAEPAFTHVKITNHNDFDLDDRFDNQVFHFPSKKTVTIPLDVGRHLFGLGASEQEAMLHTIKRYGWNTAAMLADNRHVTYYKNLEIRPVRFQMVEVPAHYVEVGDDPVPARAHEHRAGNRKKTLSAMADVGSEAKVT